VNLKKKNSKWHLGSPWWREKWNQIGVKYLLSREVVIEWVVEEKFPKSSNHVICLSGVCASSLT
jgi:hypothetical protein